MIFRNSWPGKNLLKVLSLKPTPFVVLDDRKFNFYQRLNGEKLSPGAGLNSATTIVP
jgi:hypothetical protein